MRIQKKRLGSLLAAFGAGILVGLWLEGGFFCVCAGLILTVMGLMLCKK